MIAPTLKTLSDHQGHFAIRKVNALKTQHTLVIFLFTFIKFSTNWTTAWTWKKTTHPLLSI